MSRYNNPDNIVKAKMRIEVYAVLEHSGFLSMAMMMSLLRCLESTYSISSSVTVKLLNEAHAEVDFNSSYSCVDVEYKEGS